MLTVKSLTYIANARLPTEKAHGYQICKMCEAFALTGTHVLLVHPYRNRGNKTLREASVFEYYGIPSSFQVRTLPNLDVVRLQHLIPNRAFITLFFIHSLLWSLYAVLAMRQEKADLYFTRDVTVAYWLVKLGLPAIYEAHLVPKQGQKWLLQKIACNPKVRLVVVLTSFIKQQLIETGFPAEKVIILPDGVDLSLFEDLPSKKECRSRLGLPTDRPIIGYIGRFRTLEMEKGIPELVEAVGYLPSMNHSEPLLLCVGGPMDVVPAYLDLADRTGIPKHRLRFVDRVPNTEVPYWIRACDVVTIPWPWTEFSAYFTSPLKLFEYMASGVPILASDLPSIREVLRHKENAYLVPPDDPHSLASGIETLLQDIPLRKKLARQALLDVQRYTWQKRAEAIISKLNESNHGYNP